MDKGQGRPYPRAPIRWRGRACGARFFPQERIVKLLQRERRCGSVWLVREPPDAGSKRDCGEFREVCRHQCRATSLRPKASALTSQSTFMIATVPISTTSRGSATPCCAPPTSSAPMSSTTASIASSRMAFPESSSSRSCTSRFILGQSIDLSPSTSSLAARCPASMTPSDFWKSGSPPAKPKWSRRRAEFGAAAGASRGEEA